MVLYAHIQRRVVLGMALAVLAERYRLVQQLLLFLSSGPLSLGVLLIVT
ncbi:MAG: hypothetical protein HXY34_04890 [Candidatus Thorarchaeota archaeon]|nr:hypothetical protein [Candidatus Thorarchaeota archaeon]